jgi:hypothetical protein
VKVERCVCVCLCIGVGFLKPRKKLRRETFWDDAFQNLGFAEHEFVDQWTSGPVDDLGRWTKVVGEWVALVSAQVGLV